MKDIFSFFIDIVSWQKGMLFDIKILTNFVWSVLSAEPCSVINDSSPHYNHVFVLDFSWFIPLLALAMLHFVITCMNHHCIL